MRDTGYPIGWHRDSGLDEVYWNDGRRGFLPTNRELHQECVEWMEHRRGVATNLTDEWAVVMTRITEEQFEFSEQDKAWYMPYKGM